MCHTDQSRAKRASLSLVKLLEDPRIVIGLVALYGGCNAQSRNSVQSLASNGTIRVVSRALLLLEMPSAAAISPKVPRSRKFAL